MKTLLLVLAIVASSLAAHAQLKAPFVVKNDTLHIADYQTVRYIKIGDKVYKITSPALEEVNEPNLHFSSPLNIWRGGGVTTPAGPYIPVDSLFINRNIFQL